MSNYPDNFNQAAFDAIHASPQDYDPVAYGRIQDAQAIWCFMLSTLVSRLKGAKFFLSSYELETAMEGVGEMLSDCVSVETCKFGELGFHNLTAYPVDYKRQCSAAAEELLEAVRLRPISTTDLFNSLYTSFSSGSGACQMRNFKQSDQDGSAA